MSYARSAGLLCCVAALSAGPALGQTFQRTDNWLLGCDNLRDCTILGLDEEDSVPGAHVRIFRSGQPDAAIELDIAMSFREDAGPFTGIEIASPRLPEGALFLSSSWAHETEYLRVSLDEPNTQTLLEALPQMGVLEVRGVFADGGATATRTISFDEGRPLIEALDRFQRREGTVTAVLLTGEAPAGAVPQPPPPPAFLAPSVVTAARPPMRPQGLAEHCHFLPDEDEDEVKIDREGWLAPDLAYWLVRCFMGASSAASVFLIGPEAGPLRLAPFAVPEALQDVIETSSLPNLDYSPEEMSLDFFHIEGGAGGCGRSGSFRWDGGQFQLTFYAMLNACRAAGVDDWLVLWRSENDGFSR